MDTPTAPAPEGFALTNIVLFGNDWTHLSAFLVALAVTFVVATVARFVFRNQLRRLAERSSTMLDDILLDTLDRPIYWIIITAGAHISLGTLVLPKRGAQFIEHTSVVVITLFVTWALTNLVSAMRLHYVDPITEKSESKLDDQVVPIIEKTIKAGLWMFATLIVFSNLGYDILSLITGLGIGGIAIAMAAQDTLSNVFGSVTIFADQPFQVDDLITVEGHTGVVDEVGLRTSRLRTADGVMITIPNSAMVAGPVINHTVEGKRRKQIVLGLVYDTTAEQLKAAMQGACEVVEAHVHTRDVSVGFVNFADSALEIAIRFGVPESEDYGRVCSEVNLALKERFDREGWGMAFPTVTLDGLGVLKAS